MGSERPEGERSEELSLQEFDAAMGCIKANTSEMAGLVSSWRSTLMPGKLAPLIHGTRRGTKLCYVLP